MGQHKHRSSGEGTMYGTGIDNERWGQRREDSAGPVLAKSKCVC